MVTHPSRPLGVPGKATAISARHLPKRLLEDGLRRIKVAMAMWGPDDQVRFWLARSAGLKPKFTCASCNDVRDDFSMITGDKVPICVSCAGFDYSFMEQQHAR